MRRLGPAKPYFDLPEFSIPYMNSFTAGQLDVSNTFDASTPSDHLAASVAAINNYYAQAAQRVMNFQDRSGRMQIPDMIEVYPGEEGQRQASGGVANPGVGRPAKTTRGAKTVPGNQQAPYVFESGQDPRSPEEARNQAGMRGANTDAPGVVLPENTDPNDQPPTSKLFEFGKLIGENAKILAILLVVLIVGILILK